MHLSIKCALNQRNDDILKEKHIRKDNGCRDERVSAFRMALISAY